MQEITLDEFEKNFDEIMNKVEMGTKFLLRTTKDEGIILTCQVDEAIQTGLKNGVLREFK